MKLLGVTSKWLSKLSRKDWFMMLTGATIVLLIVVLAQLFSSSHQPLKPASDHITTRWIPTTVKRWEQPINEMAKKYSIDPNLIAIIITMESGGYSKAKSEANAQGLMQIVPLTAKDIAAKHLKNPQKTYDIYDPRTNIEFGTAYLAWLRDEFGTAEQGPDWNSTVELIAAGYNGGPGAANSLEQGKGLRDPQTVIYSRDAFNMWRERNSPSSPTFDRWKERGGFELIDKAKAETKNR